tara:strand:+ start:467 stop:1213 length:747 start_codon:yes stop_codon:yes gene_type:complete
MANLREYLYGYEEGGALPPTELAVFNANYTTVNNGGASCVFAAPAGTNNVAGEIWAGGGAGAGGCCCSSGCAGMPGAYITFTGDIITGDQITICAAGSTCCRPASSCQAGFPSYVCNAGKWCATACGGCWGQYLNAGFTCHTLGMVCQVTGGCLYGGAAIAGRVGYKSSSYTFSNNYCLDGHFSAGVGPEKTGHNRFFASGCQGAQNLGTCYFGTFPGGGGITAQHTTSGATLCGAPGAGGLVYLVFR